MTGLEVSDTKNDLRNVFFREFWVYRVKGLNIFCFTKKLSAVFIERDVSSTISRLFFKYSSDQTFK